VIQWTAGLETQIPPFTFGITPVGNQQSVLLKISVHSSLRSRRGLASLLRSCFLMVVVASVCLVHGFATSFEQLRPDSSKSSDRADIELSNRIAEAQAAQNSGDAATVTLANQRLIALALREMGQLRLLESAYPQAVELYRRSLDFQDSSDTRVDLAIAELQANRTDDAISDSDRALAADPNNERAFNVRGRAWVKKQDYAKAAEAFEQAIRLRPDVETLYSLGICLLQSKDPRQKERAPAIFQQMQRFAGDSGSLHVLFGRAYRDVDDMSSAIREFQRAVALHTRTPHAHYFLALARLAVNEWKATPAIKAEFSQELGYYPHDYLANYMLGFIASGERQYDVSDRYLKTASQLNPSQPEPWLYMGLNAYAQNDAKHSEEMFRKAIQLTGNDESRSNFQIRRAYVDLGRILAKSGRTQESEVYLTKARDLQNKTLEQGQQNLAMAFAGGAGSAAAIVPLSAQSEAEAAPVALGDTDPFARVNASVLARANLTEPQRAAADSQEARLRSVLGQSFSDLGTSEAVRSQYVEALAHYQEGERWNASTSGLAKNLGLSAFRIHDYAEAIRGFSQALKEQPTDAPVRSLLGMAYFGAEKYAVAVDAFSPLGMRGMQDSTVGYAWAASLVHMSDLTGATKVLAEFEKQNRSEDQLMLAGQLWIEIADYARATATFHRALQSNPSLRKAHYFVGQADMRWEHWPEAAEEFQAELKLDPADPDAKYNLGFVYLQQSRVEEAAELFRQVIDAHPDHASAQYQLGKILLERGQLSEAVNHLETASRFSPQTDYIHYQLQAAYRKESRFAEADHELALYKELKAKQREQSLIPPGQNR
jgi:tetratricopeptide (TPR) repeat protein